MVVTICQKTDVLPSLVVTIYIKTDFSVPMVVTIPVNSQVFNYSFRHNKSSVLQLQVSCLFNDAGGLC